MLSAIFISLTISGAAARLTRRRPPVSTRSSESIFPTASIIPVNIVKISLDREIGFVAIHGKFCERRRFRKQPRGKLRHRDAPCAHHLRSIEENHFVHNFGFERRAVEFGSGFEEYIEHLAAAELADGGLQVKAAALSGHVSDFGTYACESARPGRVELH